jgi:hypothetical protein
LPDERSRHAVDLSERLADGPVSEEDVEAAGNAAAEVVEEDVVAEEAARAADHALPPPDEAWYLTIVWESAAKALEGERFREQGASAHQLEVWADESAESSAPLGWTDLDTAGLMAAVIRDILGNPFRPVSLNGSWLIWNDGSVPKMAQAIYDHRRFADLPILADALEDAGCADADILTHCRSGGEHVRGCWVVDLLLGKQ